MRTTVTLDPDVVAKLKAIARERGISFKQALNSAVRAGLGGQPRAREGLQAVFTALGLRPGFNLDKALQLAAALEDEEIVHKLELASEDRRCEPLALRDRRPVAAPQVARSWLEERLSGDETIAFSWLVTPTSHASPGSAGQIRSTRPDSLAPELGGITSSCCWRAKSPLRRSSLTRTTRAPRSRRPRSRRSS